ncbi:DUF6988 family protein, partial [Burkholderia sp. SIMBA_062]|uniref:DUF6988 family protein n=1 Tax=Burkholderia sp. SIMBA_062 TaxID=3085803 RepID=UPI00397928AB
GKLAWLLVHGSILSRVGASTKSGAVQYRPQFEAYTRGEWYHYCATDSDLHRYVRGDEPPRIAKLASDLKQAAKRSGDVILQVKQRTWGTMCAFTHGGVVQVKARTFGDEVRQSYTGDHSSKLLAGC